MADGRYFEYREIALRQLNIDRFRYNMVHWRTFWFRSDQNSKLYKSSHTM